ANAFRNLFKLFARCHGSLQNFLLLGDSSPLGMPDFYPAPAGGLRGWGPLARLGRTGLAAQRGRHLAALGPGRVRPAPVVLGPSYLGGLLDRLELAAAQRPAQ